MLELLDIDHVSDAETISLCHSTTADIISDPESSAIVARLSPDIAVKFSCFMTIGEFRNMQIAYQRLDPSNVRVPKPYRFIKTEAAVVPEEPDDDLQSSSKWLRASLMSLTTMMKMMVAIRRTMRERLVPLNI